ncbi:hypothetical protein Lal_00034418 [Lupinus albus]|nr:hypothetical protein Lal_00034418 [Lupinus albus]
MSISQSLWTLKLMRRQFYIIVSYVMRINKSKRLKILIHDKNDQSLKSTTNVVYKEVYQKI